jgi:dCMP deaminase
MKKPITKKVKRGKVVNKPVVKSRIKSQTRAKDEPKIEVNKALKEKMLEIVSGRQTWDEYFLAIMKAVGGRGTCDRGRSGCVIVKNKRLISSGYVGSPAGCKHCDEVGHEMHTVTREDGTVSRHCIRTSHAEENAIVQAAKVGVSTDGATLYCQMAPCYTCAKMIINAGIKKVIAFNDYHASVRTGEIFKEAGIEYVLVNNQMQEYADQ